jgi:hypothetical protein
MIRTLSLSNNPNTNTFSLSKTLSKAIPNLGGDCVLVVPPNDGRNYAHFARFCQHASLSTKKAFWKKVAESIEKFVKTTKLDKVYVSTHGNGVAWLHVRICKSPKYFH